MAGNQILHSVYPFTTNYMVRMEEIGLDLFTSLQICQFISLPNANQTEIYIRIQIPKQSKMRWCYVISDIFYLIRKVSSWSWSHGSLIFYDYLCNQCLSPLTLWVRTTLRRGVLDAILCGKVGQCFATGMWLSPGNLVSSTNKADHHDIAKILLKVALSTIHPLFLITLFIYIDKLKPFRQ